MEYQIIVELSLRDVKWLEEDKLKHHILLKLVITIFGIFQADKLPGEIEVQRACVIGILLILLNIHIYV